MPKTMRPEQSAAVHELVAAFQGRRLRDTGAEGEPVFYPAQKTMIGYGGVGCGKTLIGCQIAKIMGLNRVLIVVPPCGGVVFDQWRDELVEMGAGDRTLLYHGVARVSQLAAWRKKSEDDPENVHYVVTSIQTLHADALVTYRARFASSSSNAKKKKKELRNDDQWKAALSVAVEALGRFDFAILDEFHEFRNGSPPTDERRAVDPTKAYYVVLDAIVARSRPFILGLSATPIYNTPGELFSFLRLGHTSGAHEQGLKLSILERSRTSIDKQVKQMWKQSTRRISAQNVVAIAAPIVPETTYVDIRHSYSESELAIVNASYARVFQIASQFLTALGQFFGCPENPVLRARRDYLKNRFLSELTHAKRITISPHSFQNPPQRAPDPVADPAYDNAGNIRYVKDTDGEEVPLGRLLPFDVAGSFASVPLESISKFNAVIDDLAANTDKRAMVVCEFVDPIELLAHYITQKFPGRAVYKFHGKVPRRDRQLAAFKNGAPDAILLASRGACGQAINIETTTTDAEGKRHPVVQYQLDLPMAQASQAQCEGRIKRPLAQGWPDDPLKVTQWVVKKVLAENANPTLEDWCSQVMSIKNARCTEMFADRDEQTVEAKDDLSEEVEEGVMAPLKNLVDLFAVYAPAGSRKRPALSGTLPAVGKMLKS